MVPSQAGQIVLETLFGKNLPFGGVAQGRGPEFKY
jgi:hypothetical protein